VVYVGYELVLLLVGVVEVFGYVVEGASQLVDFVVV